MIRVFLEETRAAVNAASLSLAGNAVPIVSIRVEGDNVTIASDVHLLGGALPEVKEGSRLHRGQQAQAA